MKKIENSDLVYGATEGIIENGNAYVEMMSVRPGYKRNSINSKMIDALQRTSDFRKNNAQVVWDSPTEDGMKFIKSYSGDKAKFWFGKSGHRPKNFLKLYPDGNERIVD